MSQYKVVVKEEAQADLGCLLRHEPKAYKKALRFYLRQNSVLTCLLFMAITMTSTITFN